MKHLVIYGQLIAVAAMSVTTTLAGDEPQKMKSVEAIDWSVLAKLLPTEVEGMTVSKIDGGTISMSNPQQPGTQISYSNAERDYTQGEGKTEKEITIRLTDTGYHEFLKAPFMMVMEYDSPSGTMKSEKFGEYPCKLIIDKDDGVVDDSQVLVMVSDRILFSGKGNENVTVEEVKALMKLVDLEKLSALAKDKVEKAEE